MEGKWIRPATETEQTRQELGVNNPEQGQSPKQDPVPSVSFICRLFSQPVGFFYFCRAEFPVIQCYLGISAGKKMILPVLAPL